LITHRYPLTEFERALEKLDAGEACKVVLFPAEAAEPLAVVPGEKRAPAGNVVELARWAHR
jgi:hypothetical protein